MQQIKKDDKVYAYIIRSGYSKDGIDFITPPDNSQQLAYMKHSAGHEIAPHCHQPITRTINDTQEILFIKNGELRVDFYTQNQEYFVSEILHTGDIVLLSSGGHGFKFLKPTELIEIKQGPFDSAKDKIRFHSIPEEKIIYNE